MGVAGLGPARWLRIGLLSVAAVVVSPALVVYELLVLVALLPVWFWRRRPAVFGDVVVALAVAVGLYAVAALVSAIF